MKRQVNDKAHLELILTSIGNAFEFTRKYDSYELFANDLICCHAVAYNIQCIGESVYKISSEFKVAHPEVGCTMKTAGQRPLGKWESARRGNQYLCLV